MSFICNATSLHQSHVTWTRVFDLELCGLEVLRPLHMYNRWIEAVNESAASFNYPGPTGQLPPRANSSFDPHVSPGQERRGPRVALRIKGFFMLVTPSSIFDAHVNFLTASKNGLDHFLDAYQLGVRLNLTLTSKFVVNVNFFDADSTYVKTP